MWPCKHTLMIFQSLALAFVSAADISGHGPQNGLHFQASHSHAGRELPGKDVSGFSGVTAMLCSFDRGLGDTGANCCVNTQNTCTLPIMTV